MKNTVKKIPPRERASTKTHMQKIRKNLKKIEILMKSFDFLIIFRTAGPNLIKFGT